MDNKICILCLTTISSEDYQSLFPTKIGNDSLDEVLRLHFWELNERIIITCKSCLEKVTTFHEFYLEVRANHDQCKERKLPNIRFNEYNIKEEAELDISNSSDNGEYDAERLKPSSGSKKVRRKPSNELPARKRENAKRTSWKLILEENYEKFLLRFSMKCQLCSVSFQSLADARKHYRSEHNRKGYLMCSDCDRPFFDYGRIVDHLEWHEDAEKFMCTICNRTFVDGTCMRRHIKEIHGARMFKCDQCDATFTNRNIFEYHMRSIHSENENECKLCKTKLKTKESLRYHIRNVHDNSFSRTCDICGKFLKSSQSYERHHKLVHTEIQKVKCDICGKWMNHINVLRDHMNQLHQGKPQICKYCGRTMKNWHSLCNHIRWHHSNISYTCDICGKSFKYASVLKEHMYKHSGNMKLYTCDYCPKTFRSRSNKCNHRKEAHPVEYQQSMMELK